MCAVSSTTWLWNILLAFLLGLSILLTCQPIALTALLLAFLDLPCVFLVGASIITILQLDFSGQSILALLTHEPLRVLDTVAW